MIENRNASPYLGTVRPANAEDPIRMRASQRTAYGKRMSDMIGPLCTGCVRASQLAVRASTSSAGPCRATPTDDQGWLSCVADRLYTFHANTPVN